MSHLEGPYLRFPEISNSSNSAFFSETEFLIIRTSGSIFIFYLFELIGNLLYTLEALLYHPPQTLFVGGILFSHCPSIHLSVCPPVHVSVCDAGFFLIS